MRCLAPNNHDVKMRMSFAAKFETTISGLFFLISLTANKKSFHPVGLLPGHSTTRRLLFIQTLSKPFFFAFRKITLLFLERSVARAFDCKQSEASDQL